MPIKCSQCGREYNATKLEEGKLKCVCGFSLDLSLIETADDFLRYCEGVQEREKAKEIQRDAQRICQMILDENCSAIDIEIAKRTLEEKVEKLFPDKMETYRMIYEARFERLWNQFRRES